jgi:hypothetical protein
MFFTGILFEIYLYDNFKLFCPITEPQAAIRGGLRGDNVFFLYLPKNEEGSVAAAFMPKQLAPPIG